MNTITAAVATLTISVSVIGTAYAQAQTRFVATTGVDVGDCSVAPCATIQFATDHAMPGDTVRVAAGTYDENVVIQTNDLTLLGAGPAVTTIRGVQQFGSVVRTSIQTNDVATFAIEGFTITDIPGASDSNVGIALSWLNRAGVGQWVVRGNIVREVGDGVVVGFYFGDAVIENNLIVNNSRYGILNERGYVTVRNNTIVGNGWVGYREVFGASNNFFFNNIVAFNGAALPDPTFPGGFMAASSNYYIAFNNLFGNANGDFYADDDGRPRTPVPATGDMSVDPMFRDAANGDYRLAPGSPSIDAGTNDNAPATDLDGRMRPIDGDSDGSAVTDMGAFESEEETDPTPPFVSAAAEASTASPLGDPRVPVIVWGLVRDESGVNGASGTFAVTDEYGQVEPQGTFSIKPDGRYSFVVWLEAGRPDDRNGRQFLITVTGEDDDGHVGIASTTVAIRAGGLR